MKQLQPPAVAEAKGRSRALHTYCRCNECRALDAAHPRDDRQLVLMFPPFPFPREVNRKRRAEQLSAQQKDKCA